MDFPSLICIKDQQLLIEQCESPKCGLTSFCSQLLEIKCPENCQDSSTVQLVLFDLSKFGSP